MKKLLTLTLFVAIILGACKKEGTRIVEKEQELNSIIKLHSDGEKEGSVFLLSMCLGHNRNSCNGCVMYNGHIVHFDCMGHGNECATSAIVQLQHDGTSMTATTMDTFNLTTEDFFLMPDRSLLTEDEKCQPVYLNIPAQLIYRDSTTLQFTLNGLYYSARAAYVND